MVIKIDKLVYILEIIKRGDFETSQKMMSHLNDFEVDDVNNMLNGTYIYNKFNN